MTKLKKIIYKYTKSASMRNSSFIEDENEWIFELNLLKNTERKLLKELQNETEIVSASLFTHSGILGE